MSAGYVAVGWNRQKKYYDLAIALGCLLYLTLFAAFTAWFNPQYTFETLLVRATATLVLLMLHVVLSIGPLTRLNRKFLPLLYNRRHLGVTLFFIALVHGSFGLFQFHALGNVSPLVSLFSSNTQFNSLAAFPFQTLGFLALLIFFLMAITSHDFWLHNLGPRCWKTLHMLVYLAYALVLMHVMLGVIQYETNPVFVILLALGAIWLTGLHLLAGFRERKIDRHAAGLLADGYQLLGAAANFDEGRAKIFVLGDERIAVYRYQQKLYAIHNVCKHQGGPLGEGRIVDGCITCPWHGYQYLPHNGQSPPPFTERVSTYALLLKEGMVWINPQPFPEGTAQQGLPVQEM